LENYLWQLVGLMQPRPRQLVWQVDGRPMSGDIGTGTTRATLQLARKVLDWHLPGYVQLAGGTNEATLPKARQLGLGIGGIAYGSYARQVVADVAEVAQLEARPRLLAEAIARARILVQQVKRHPLPVRPPIPVPAFDAVTHSSTV
jgi:lysophospholipase L1-like esterase